MISLKIVRLLLFVFLLNCIIPQLSLAMNSSSQVVSPEQPSFFQQLYQSTSRLVIQHPILCTVGGTMFIWSILHYMFQDSGSKNISNRDINFNRFLKFSDKEKYIVVGKSTLCAKVLVTNSTVCIAQTSVAYQQGLSCAYHALKNGIAFINELECPAGNLNSNLHDTGLYRRLFGVVKKQPWYFFWKSEVYGPWKRFVKDTKYGVSEHFDHNIENISTGMVDLLIEHEKKRRWLLGKNIQLNVSVIEDDRILGLSHGPVGSSYNSNDTRNRQSPDYITNPVIEECFKARKNNQSYSHLFLKNTGMSYELNQNGTMSEKALYGNSSIRVTEDNHFYAIILHQDAITHHRIYYVVDSLNIDRTTDESVQQLIAVIESAIEYEIN